MQNIALQHSIHAVHSLSLGGLFSDQVRLDVSEFPRLRVAVGIAFVHKDLFGTRVGV